MVLLTVKLAGHRDREAAKAAGNTLLAGSAVRGTSAPAPTQDAAA